jgi:DNA-binding MarR family transcriptional regulator
MERRGDADPAWDLADAMRDECLGTRISRLHRVVARRFEQALRAYDLSIPQMEILSYLVLRGVPARPSELAEALYAERSTISRNLAVLQQRGWVEVASTSATGRSMTIAVTAPGASALAAARTAWADTQQLVRDQLGGDAPEVIDAWLAALS